MIYLVKSECRNGTYFKVGFTHNILKRLIPYFTHNPNVVLLETIKTYHKTKQNLETTIHSEILAKGYTFKVAPNGTVTEWFFVPMKKEQEFAVQGLSQFQCCKNRQINRVRV